jgi:hypothetical protein
MSDDARRALLTPREVAEEFPWIVAGLREIASLIESGRPGLARAKADQMVETLEGRGS